MSAILEMLSSSVCETLCYCRNLLDLTCASTPGFLWGWVQKCWPSSSFREEVKAVSRPLSATRRKSLPPIKSGTLDVLNLTGVSKIDLTWSGYMKRLCEFFPTSPSRGSILHLCMSRLHCFAQLFISLDVIVFVFLIFLITSTKMIFLLTQSHNGILIKCLKFFEVYIYCYVFVKWGSFNFISFNSLIYDLLANIFLSLLMI